MSIFNPPCRRNSDLAQYCNPSPTHPPFRARARTPNAERQTPNAIRIFGLAVILFGLSTHIANAQKLRIGVSMKTLDAPYFAAQGKAAEEEVKKLGGTTISADAQNDLM